MKENDKLGFFSLFFMVVGLVIGAGIFTMLTEMVGFAGRSLCLAVLLGAVLALINAIPSIFISSTLELPGGNYTQGMALLPPVLGGINGVVARISTFGFGAYTLGMASYTMQLMPGITGVEKAISLIYLVLFFLMGLKGTAGAAKIQNIMSVCLFLALGVFIFGGLPAIEPGYFEPEGFFADGVGSFFYAASMLSMSSSGAAGILSFSKESKNPKRDIPLAILLGTVAVAVIYFLMAMVTAGILPIDQVAGKNLGVVADVFLSKPMYLFFIVGGALFAMGTSLNGLLASTPQPWLKMVDDGWLPSFMGKKIKNLDYPWVIFGMYFVIGGLLPLVFNMNIATISAFFTFPNYILSMILAIATLRIPKLYPEQWNKSPFKVPQPIFVFLNLLGVASAAFLTYNFIANIDTTMVIGMFIAIGIVVAYVTYRYKSGHVDMEKIRSEFQ